MVLKIIVPDYTVMTSYTYLLPIIVLYTNSQDIRIISISFKIFNR